MGKDFRVLTTPAENKRLNAALFGTDPLEAMLFSRRDVPQPTFNRCRQPDLAEKRRPFVTSIALRGVSDQNSRRGTFEKVDVVLLDTLRAGLDQGGVEALPPAMRDRQRKLREEATGDQSIRMLQETAEILIQSNGRTWFPQMQRSGKIARAEPNPAAGKEGQDLDFERVNHIDEGDASEGSFQMPEVDVAKMSASKNCHMISSRKLPAEETFARLQMASPRATASIGTVAYGDLLGKEAVRSCTKRGGCEAPFQ